MRKYLAFFLLVTFPLAAYGSPECSVRDAQSVLANAGYDPGPVDGVWGTATGRAVGAFQNQNGLAPTSELDQATCDVLLRPKQEAVQIEPDEDIRKTQEALLRFGLYFDELDGKPGPSTEQALLSLRRVTGVPTLPEGDDLLQFIRTHAALREKRWDNWFDLLDREPLDDDAIQRIEQNRSDPSHYQGRTAYIPTELPSHIGYRDETGQFQRIWEREDQPGVKNPEPAVFAGTAPFEFLGYYVNLSNPDDTCEFENSHGDVFRDAFRYLELREAAGLPLQSYYYLRASSSHVDFNDDPELWCLEHARWGLRYAEPGYSLPEQATAKLAAFDAKLAAEAAQAEAAAQAAALIDETRARMAAIDDPVALDGLLEDALSKGSDVEASAALESLEKLLAERAAWADADAVCHRRLASFGTYVPDFRDLDLALPIFATIGAVESDHSAAFRTKSEHAHDIISYLKLAIMNAFLSSGQGETVSVLPAPGLTFEEFLVPDSLTGPILDGAVIRIDGNLALGYVGAPAVQFSNTGDKWHRLTFRIGTKTGLTYMRGNGSVAIDDTTLTFDGTTCNEIGTVLTPFNAPIQKNQAWAYLEVVYRIGMNSAEVQVRELDPTTNRFVEIATFVPGRSSVPSIYTDFRLAANAVYRIAVAEGTTVWQVVEALKIADFLSGEVTALPFEGSIAPDSYEVFSGSDRNELLARMMASQAEIIAGYWKNRTEGLPISTPEEAMILASIVENETGLPDEYSQIASVFLNRLNKGMKLQADPTVVYGITKGQGVLGRGLRQSDLRRNTPFNTYVNEGLPPTPIANPGRAAIEAVLNPADAPFIFFVEDGTGGHAFATTLADHSANVAKWRSIEANRK